MYLGAKSCTRGCAQAAQRRRRQYAALGFSLCFWLLCSLQTGSAQTACNAGACVFIGPRLASFDSSRGALSSALFSSLLGSSVALSVLDWNTLARSEVKLSDYLEALALELSVSSPSQALTTRAQLVRFINAAATLAAADGNTALVRALDTLTVPITGLEPTVRLADLLEVSFPTGSLTDSRLNVLSLITGLVQLYNYQNVLTTPQPVTVSAAALGGLGLGGVVNGVELFAQVVEPPVYTCGGAGTEFYSAAVRIKLNLDLIDLTPDSAPLVSALASALNLRERDVQATINLGQLELYADVARARGVITAVDALSQAVTLRATPGVASLYLGQISDSLFYNRVRQLTPDDVQPGSIGTLQLRVTQALTGITLADISTPILARAAAEGEAPFANGLSFTPSYPKSQTASSSSTFVTQLLGSLVSNLQLELGDDLGSLLGPLVSGTVLPALTTVVRSTLNPLLEPVLSQLVDPLLEALGVRLGEVDVTVFGVARSCSVSGRVYHDRNRDGAHDNDEAWQDGVAVVINAVQNNVVVRSVAVTPGLGDFTLSALPAGDYTFVIAAADDQLSPKAPAGFFFVDPPSGSRTSHLGEDGLNLSGQDWGLAFVDPGVLTLTERVRNISRDGSFETANSAVPGDILEYQVTYENTSQRAVSSVKIFSRVPEPTQLVQNAYGASEAELRCPDGTLRELEVGDVSSLVLEIAEHCGLEALEPGMGGKLRFRARVR